MDPYDLPDELSSLQSQDMSKIGFMQDLLRGIRKVLETEKKPEQTRVPRQVVQTAASDGVAPGVASLMQRACLFLEDGDFNSAAEYLDRVLDIDPKYAPAYAAKVCVAFGIRKEAGLADTTFQYEDNPDWQKALRFADPQQKAVYEGYAAKVKERVTRQIRDYAWDCAMEMAVLPAADKGKLDAELAAYRASCTRSAGKRADGSRRADSRRSEDGRRHVRCHWRHGGQGAGEAVPPAGRAGPAESHLPGRNRHARQRAESPFRIGGGSQEVPDCAGLQGCENKSAGLCG